MSDGGRLARISPHIHGRDSGNYKNDKANTPRPHLEGPCPGACAIPSGKAKNLIKAKTQITKPGLVGAALMSGAMATHTARARSKSGSGTREGVVQSRGRAHQPADPEQPGLRQRPDPAQP
jgi:hypothetical protein